MRCGSSLSISNRRVGCHSRPAAVLFDTHTLPIALLQLAEPPLAPDDTPAARRDGRLTT